MNHRLGELGKVMRFNFSILGLFYSIFMLYEWQHFTNKIRTIKNKQGDF